MRSVIGINESQRDGMLSPRARVRGSGIVILKSPGGQGLGGMMTPVIPAGFARTRHKIGPYQNENAAAGRGWSEAQAKTRGFPRQLSQAQATRSRWRSR